jgi:shikimate kinase
MNKENIVLVGMPGAGKSTIGPLLSQKLGMVFIDTDLIIKEKEGRELADIVKNSGHEEFLRIQEEAILMLSVENCVIATGGSVVMSSYSMNHLKTIGKVIYLKLDFEVIEQRLSPERRLARDGGRSLRDLHDERTLLYEKYADIIIDCNKRDICNIVDEITGL